MASPQPLRLRVTTIATNRPDLARADPMFVTIVGKLDGEVETILPLLRAYSRDDVHVEISIVRVEPRIGG